MHEYMLMSLLLHVINMKAPMYSAHTMEQAESDKLYNTILGLHSETLRVVLVGSSTPSQFYTKN
jgi:hypothetical protein